MKRNLTLVLLALVWLGSACQAGEQQPTEPTIQGPETAPPADEPVDAPTPTFPALTPIPTSTEPAEETTMPESEPDLQALVDEAKVDLAQRVDVAPEAITVTEAEEVVWPDGSLGCPEPDQVYTQATVPGARIRLMANRQVYAYHAGAGRLFLCEDTSARRLPTPIQIDPGDLGGVAPPPITGEVPDELMAQIQADLTQKLGIDEATIEVVQAEAVIWSDGSLGCPKPGVVYTQALEEGYQVILAVGSQRYDYRANTRGYFFLCTDGGELPTDIKPVTPRE
ncbi:MAG: hypothetical protein R3300_09525 [Candidatus Promineifilaceae bacterium]|nr:hypothetical protein [Candidatus Promineifilaceae bacterium]